MKFSKWSYLGGSLLLAGVLAAGGGCGYKNNPVPPQTVVPKAVNDLRYSLDDSGANLSWSYPVENVNGDDIGDFLTFELYRAEIPLDNFCGNCPIPFTGPVNVEGGLPNPEKRGIAEYSSGLLRSGNKYFFKVRSRTSWLAASEDSNIVSFVYHTPAAAPQNLQAAMTGSGVRLSWTPVTTLIDGSGADLPIRYQVLKSVDGTPFAPLGSVQEDTAFVDTKIQSNKTYSYKVKSSMLFKDEMLDGSLSPAATVAIKDTEPPPMVTGVTVIASTSNIRVFWDRVDAADLAGYTIYRRLESQTEAVRIGKVGATQTLYVDSDVPEDVKVYYSIAAFDKDGNEGKPSKETTTRH